MDSKLKACEHNRDFEPFVMPKQQPIKRHIEGTAVLPDVPSTQVDTNSYVVPELPESLQKRAQHYTADRGYVFIRRPH